MTLVPYFSDLSSSLLSLLVVIYLYVSRCHFHFYINLDSLALPLRRTTKRRDQTII